MTSTVIEIDEGRQPALDSTPSASICSWLSRSDLDVSRICRICLSGRKPETLIKPCNCSGSLASVHVQCLQRWFVENSAEWENRKCGICHGKYDEDSANHHAAANLRGLQNGNLHRIGHAFGLQRNGRKAIAILVFLIAMWTVNVLLFVGFLRFYFLAVCTFIVIVSAVIDVVYLAKGVEMSRNAKLCGCFAISFCTAGYLVRFIVLLVFHQFTMATSVFFLMISIGMHGVNKLNNAFYPY